MNEGVEGKRKKKGKTNHYLIHEAEGRRGHCTWRMRGMGTHWTPTFFFSSIFIYVCFPGGAVGKNPPANTGDARDAGSIPRSGRSPGGGHGNPIHYSCLENPMDREAWRAAVHGSQRVGHDWATSLHFTVPCQQFMFKFFEEKNHSLHYSCKLEMI